LYDEEHVGIPTNWGEFTTEKVTSIRVIAIAKHT